MQSAHSEGRAETQQDVPEALRAEYDELVARMARLERALGIEASAPGAPTVGTGAAERDALALIVFDGSLDGVLAAFTIATGAAAMGMKTSMFFTFWATAVLRRSDARVAKGLSARLFGWMLPAGPRDLPLSRFNLVGGGAYLMRRTLEKQGAASVEEMLGLAADLGVEIHVCTTSMDLLGLHADEIIDYPELSYCGVARFLETAIHARTTLFI